MASNKTTLTALFETGDIPTGGNFASLIDSCVNQAETSVQSMLGPLNPTELITPRVSATNAVFTGTVQVQGILSAASVVFESFSASAAMFGSVSANTLNATTINTTTVSATTLNAATVQAATVSATNLFANGDASVSGKATTGALATGVMSATAVNATTVFGATVSATTLQATTAQITTVSATNLFANGDASVSGKATIGAVSTGIVSAASLNLSGDMSANRVYASAATFQSGIIQGVGIVSALGTAQSTAAPLTFIINRGKGVVDGQTTGFVIQANRTGLVQYLYNEGASANLWPPTGGFINGGAANTAFSLVASASVVIMHLTASAYGVK